jgi:EAL domain-containing protein (putative c-di-GMP-specific phosphodiesterase class I)/CheY-like chemotaxis protein
VGRGILCLKGRNACKAARLMINHVSHAAVETELAVKCTFFVRSAFTRGLYSCARGTSRGVRRGPVLMLKSRCTLLPPDTHIGAQSTTSDPGVVALPCIDAFVVDDEEAICAFVAATLQELGLESASFRTGEAAIAALQQHRPDVIFLDIALGRSDAIDVIRALAVQRYSGMIQLMSGRRSSLLEDVHRIGSFHGLTMGPPLAKPFRKEAIRQAVSNLQLFDRPEITISRASTLEPGLDEALRNGWLELWYEPKIDLRTGRVAGAEGVIRYCHPEQGVHAIEPLLPQASKDTLTAITEHFLRTALHDWNALDQAGLYVRTAIGASFDALANLDVPALVRQEQPQSRKWPGLILEVSEREIIDDLNLAFEIATQLRIYDVVLAINNFGAGSSSLERLRELPFGELKLHPGFVAGCADDARNAGICRAAVDLAHRFGAIAVANGVENASDLALLRNMGCDLGQGPLFADPKPLPRLINQLNEHRNTREAWFPAP